MKAWLLAGVVWLLLAGTAEAATTPYIPGPGMQRWQEIGTARFPSACEPMFVTSDEQPDGIAAWADQSTCTITLYSLFWTERPTHRCSLLVHEYGHLAGLEHSDDPFSIMHPAAPVFGSQRCLHPRRWKRRDLSSE